MLEDDIDLLLEVLDLLLLEGALVCGVILLQGGIGSAMRGKWLR